MDANPQGGLGPWISESAATPDLLAEAGYRYVLDWAMDDQPVYLRLRNGGRLLALPYPQELNDIPAIVARQASGAEFADMIVDAFDEMLEQSSDAPLVMGIALHAYIVGQPHRLRPLRRALRHIAAMRDKIWITTAGRIADYCLVFAGGRSAALAVKIERLAQPLSCVVLAANIGHVPRGTTAVPD